MEEKIVESKPTVGLGGKNGGGDIQKGLDLFWVNCAGKILFVGGDNDWWWVGAENFAEVAFALEERVGVRAVDDEDDTVGASGEGFANEAELLETRAAEEVSFKVTIFEGTEIKTDSGAVDIGRDGVTGDTFDERSFADTLWTNDEDFEMPHTATRYD